MGTEPDATRREDGQTTTSTSVGYKNADGASIDGRAADDLFAQYRPLLFSIAYRMLGSVMDAEDMVQETFIRWSERSESKDGIESPKAYLSTILTRLCIDHLRSARVQRETYIGPWLPEPLVQDMSAGPEELVDQSDSLATAFLLLLERLPPRERAALILRDVFDYDYRDLAPIIHASEANCRQIVRRARARLTEARARYTPPPEQQRALILEFSRACLNGDMNGLLGLLDENVTVYSDGGGKVFAARRPVVGATQVAKLLVGIVRRAPDGLSLVPAWVNGQIGLVATLEGQIGNVSSFDIVDGRVHQIYIVANPDKLARVRLSSS
jgi:RNA polymerase sigma-70 factor (ECF subfamily)